MRSPVRCHALADLPPECFEASFVAALPGDPEPANRPRQVYGACYTRVAPMPMPEPRLLGWSDALASELGLLRPDAPVDASVEVLTGSRLLPGMQPYAARYGGHQFGHWAGQLGDGRAITLGELRAADSTIRELQLKGAGLTPYSRTADGRAVLRSSVREFLCSEAMHHLGVPTTRALSLSATGESVVRDMFYDGHPKAEPGAVVCRVSPSFVRFGNFEILAACEEDALLQRLADYVIDRHFPELGPPAVDRHARWFAEICRRTGLLLAHWMRVGFVHGVMNTDNMSILGLTIDYGPYGWLEGYDPAWTPNTTDAAGRRYCFGRQPQIALWNLARLAEALLPIIPDEKLLQDALGLYRDTYEAASRQMLADKLGLPGTAVPADDPLVESLFDVLQGSETDMTIFFRRLARVPVGEAARGLDDVALVAPLLDALYDDRARSGAHLARLAGWLRSYGARVAHVGEAPDARTARMDMVNPKYVLRNYLAQQAIDALANGDDGMLRKLLQVLERPYDEQPEHEDLAVKRPEWARHRPGCSALSCSS